MLYSIGQFAAVTKLPAKTLRFYDSIDLLKPAMVDEDNGYRYYDDNSLLRAQQILIFRACDMGLESIAKLIGAQTRQGELLEILKTHTITLEQRQRDIEGNRKKLARIIASLEKSEVPAPRIEERPELTALSIRRRGNHDSIGSILSTLFETAAGKNYEVTGAHSIIYHEEKNFDAEDMDMEIYVPVSAKNNGCELLKIFTPLLLCKILHTGKMNTLVDSYQRLFTFIEAEKHEVCGPFEESYRSEGKFFNPSGMKIEIAVPVRKRGDDERND